jgi:hypothetical protein
MEHGPGKRRLLWTVLSPKTGPKWAWKGPVDLSSISHRSTCIGYFLRYVAYFYRFYVLYAMYHPLLCLAEALRLGHPFEKLIDGSFTNFLCFFVR